MTLLVSHLKVATAKNTILGPISFKHESGTLAIMGHSGSGKTTLAKTILALMSPEQITGHISFAGKILQKDQTTLINAGQRRFGYVPQQCSPWPHLSVGKALELSKRLSFGGLNYSVLSIAEAFGLDKLLLRKPIELSGGQKQRLLIACALAAKPSLLILDEALSALDVIAKIELIKLIKDLMIDWQFSTIFITHDLAEALAMADVILLIENGQKIWQGPTNKIEEAPYPKLALDFCLKQPTMHLRFPI